MAKLIADINKGDTRTLEVRLRYQGTVPDLRADTLTFYMFAKADNTLIHHENLDVATNGINGKAYLVLNTVDTDLPVATYKVELVWVRPSPAKRRVAYQNTMRILESLGYDHEQEATP